MNGGSGASSVTYFDAGASSDTSPRSTRIMTLVAVATGFVSDARSNTVSNVIGVRSGSIDRDPNAFVKRTSSRRPTTTTHPGSFPSAIAWLIGPASAANASPSIGGATGAGVALGLVGAIASWRGAFVAKHAATTMTGDTSTASRFTTGRSYTRRVSVVVDQCAMGHSFTFFRAGGSSYQARLDSGADVAALSELDQKLWVALACPVNGLELDDKTLALVDSDHDGRIRPPEVLAAVAWMERVLVDLDELPERTATLDLDRIDDDNDEGKELLASAKVILANLGKAKEESISLDDVLDTAKIFSETKFNGDGIVPAECADDDFVRGVIADVIACLGSDADRSGKPGVSRAKVDAFFEQATALAKWWKAQSDSKDTLPIGERTAGGFEALAAVEAKVEDYFVRGRLAQFDPRAAGPLNRSESDWTAVATGELSTSSATIGAFPLARVEPGRPLSLESGLNPAWIEPMRAFEKDCVAPLLGERKSITDAEFAAIRAKLAPYRAHLAAKPATSLGALARERVEAIATSTARDKIVALIDKDEAVRPQVEAIARIEKLLRYKRDLHRLLCNFVNFRDFYLSGDAVFQAGTLYLDERSCDLCVRVDAAGAHAEIAGASNTFLVYCECTRRGTGDASEHITIAAALPRATKRASTRRETASSTTAAGAIGTRAWSRSSSNRSASAKRSGSRTGASAISSASKSRSSPASATKKSSPRRKTTSRASRRAPRRTRRRSRSTSRASRASSRPWA